jgi:hypothetical protein
MPLSSTRGPETTIGTMSFSISTHDSWGVVQVAECESLEEARNLFSQLCQDPWYREDGTVRGIELTEQSPNGNKQRLDWVAFR